MSFPVQSYNPLPQNSFGLEFKDSSVTTSCFFRNSQLNKNTLKAVKEYGIPEDITEMRQVFDAVKQRVSIACENNNITQLKRAKKFLSELSDIKTEKFGCRDSGKHTKALVAALNCDANIKAIEYQISSLKAGAKKAQNLLLLQNMVEIEPQKVGVSSQGMNYKRINLQAKDQKYADFLERNYQFGGQEPVQRGQQNQEITRPYGYEEPEEELGNQEEAPLVNPPTYVKKSSGSGDLFDKNENLLNYYGITNTASIDESHFETMRSLIDEAQTKLNNNSLKQTPTFSRPILLSDQSGSMKGKNTSVYVAIDDIKTCQNIPDNASTTVFYFSTDVLFTGSDISFKDATNVTLAMQPTGQTAMYDAIARALLIALRRLNNEEGEGSHILILTDGDDNQSSRIAKAKVLPLLQEILLKFPNHIKVSMKTIGAPKLAEKYQQEWTTQTVSKQNGQEGKTSTIVLPNLEITKVSAEDITARDNLLVKSGGNVQKEVTERTDSTRITVGEFTQGFDQYLKEETQKQTKLWEQAQSLKQPIEEESIIYFSDSD